MIPEHQILAIESLFPFFAQSDEAFRKAFLGICQSISIPKDKTICQEADNCQMLPLILQGTIRVSKLSETGREITLYRIKPGESCVVTASSILGSTGFPALAVTETDVQAVLVPSDRLIAWLHQSDPWQQFIFRLVSMRIGEIIDIVEDIAFHRLDCRLAEFLLKKTSIENPSIRTTHNEIATELGSSREVISRILKHFEQKNILELSRGKIHILHTSELEVLARE